jgi:cyclopropane-fatty-acyl-phospholipid synthase
MGSDFDILSKADHVEASIHIHHPEFYTDMVLRGHIGFSEAYMNGHWSTPDIEAVISWAILNMDQSDVLEGSPNQSPIKNVLGILNRWAHALRKNTQTNSQKNISAHYDLSNDFFSLFLDPTMTYSSAKFTAANQSLEEAQLNKYDSLCQKLRLQPTDHLLEIGTGWGGFSMYAARHYGCRITTVTISKEQFALATQRIMEAGLASQITVQLTDYRDIKGQFDKIASIEMIEAVGDEFMDTFIGQCTKLLKPKGLFALQMITCPDARYELLKNNVDFIQTYIFPGSLLPSVGRVNKAANTVGELSLIELDDFGLSYARTLREWNDAFQDKLDDVRRLGFDEVFIRKWEYYLLYCAAAFETRNISVAQALYSRPNNKTLNLGWAGRPVSKISG